MYFDVKRAHVQWPLANVYRFRSVWEATDRADAGDISEVHIFFSTQIHFFMLLRRTVTLYMVPLHDRKRHSENKNSPISRGKIMVP